MRTLWGLSVNTKLSALVAVATTGVGVDGWILKELPGYLSIISMSLGIVLASYLILVNARILRKTKLEIELLKEQALKNKQDE